MGHARQTVAAVAPDEMDLWARVVWGEARREAWIGKLAVAYTALERASIDLHGDGRPDWWGEGIGPVLRKKWQYSCLNENDPNRPLLLKVTASDPAFRECLAAAAAAWSGAAPNPMPGATHYANLAVLPKPPSWARREWRLGMIGRHTFYRVTE